MRGTREGKREREKEILSLGAFYPPFSVVSHSRGEQTVRVARNKG